MIDHVLTLHRTDNGWIVVRPSDHETGEPDVLTFEGDADALQRALYVGLDGYTQTKRGGGITITAHKHGWAHEEGE